MINHHSDERYMKIINTATEVFSMIGYKATTVDRIAKTAGISKGAIYLFFETKEEILIAVMDNYIREMIGKAEEAINGEGTPEDRLYRAIYACIMYRKNLCILDKLTLEAGQFGTVVSHNALNKFNNATIASVRQLLDKAVEQDLVHIENTEVTAFALAHLYDALTSQWELHREPLEDKVIFEMLRKVLM
ncbi:TetR/AcrR family transcriptional regulator [Paenibacillus sp. Z6-24]